MGGGPYRPGSGVLPPRILREVKAGYTEEARARQRRGRSGAGDCGAPRRIGRRRQAAERTPSRVERAGDCGRAPMAIRACDTTGSGGRRRGRGRGRIQAEVTPWIRYFSSSRSSPPRRPSSQSHPHGASGVTIASGRTLAWRHWRAPQKLTARDDGGWTAVSGEWQWNPEPVGMRDSGLGFGIALGEARPANPRRRVRRSRSIKRLLRHRSA